MEQKEREKGSMRIVNDLRRLERQLALKPIQTSLTRLSKMMREYGVSRHFRL